MPTLVCVAGEGTAAGRPAGPVLGQIRNACIAGHWSCCCDFVPGIGIAMPDGQQQWQRRGRALTALRPCMPSACLVLLVLTRKCLLVLRHRAGTVAPSCAELGCACCCTSPDGLAVSLHCGCGWTWLNCIGAVFFCMFLPASVCLLLAFYAWVHPRALVLRWPLQLHACSNPQCWAAGLD